MFNCDCVVSNSTVEAVRSPPPGKLAMKDSVLEAEEAWAMLHRRRRRDGLIKRSVARTEVARPVGCASNGSAAEGEDEGDGLNFLPAAAMTHAVSGAVETAVTDDTEGVVSSVYIRKHHYVYYAR